MKNKVLYLVSTSLIVLSLGSLGAMYRKDSKGKQRYYPKRVYGNRSTRPVVQSSSSSTSTAQQGTSSIRNSEQPVREIQRVRVQPRVGRRLKNRNRLASRATSISRNARNRSVPCTQQVNEDYVAADFALALALQNEEFRRQNAADLSKQAHQENFSGNDHTVSDGNQVSDANTETEVTSECSICVDQKVNMKTPCCTADICADCWAMTLERVRGACPFCNSQQL